MARPVASDGAERVVLHASCVAHRGCAVLITGGSGSGKSGLALGLIAAGATLVADDRTELFDDPERGLMADAPDPIRGLIEARFIGLVRAPVAGPSRVALAVDLDQREDQRLPPRRTTQLLGHSVPLLFSVPAPHLAPAILLLLAHGRHA